MLIIRLLAMEYHKELKDYINENMVKLGINIKSIREQKKYTQHQLADRIGLSLNYIGYIENCKRFPSFKTLCRIAYTLNTNPQEFFSEIKYQPKRDKKKKTIDKLVNQLEKHDLKFIQLLVKFSKMYKK